MIPSQRFESDFVFLNKRTYVHSSSMLKFVSDSFMNSIVDSPSSKMLIDGRFYSLLRSQAELLIFGDDFESDISGNVIAQFRVYSETYDVKCGLVPIRDKKINSSREVTYGVDDLQITGEVQGTAEIEVWDFFLLISNLVEMNKRLHLKSNLATEGGNILNMYINRLPVIDPLPSTQKCEAVICNLGVKRVPGGIATLNQISVPALGVESVEICFLINNKI